jgi:hypothetical protein
VTKAVIDMSMSLDGFVAGPDDGVADPLGRHGGMHVLDWVLLGRRGVPGSPVPARARRNRDEVERSSPRAARTSSADGPTRLPAVGVAATR